MKTFNTIYSSYEELYSYVNKNNINGSNILIQVFCGSSEETFINKVRLDILSIFPQAKIIGATTRAGIFEGRSKKETCILSISVFNKTELCSCIIKQENQTSYQIGNAIKEKLFKDNTKAIIAFANGKMFDGEEFLKGTASSSKDVIIAGGQADRNIGQNKAYIFTENEIIKDGAAAVAIAGEELYVNTAFNFGWIPIGKEHIVTDSDRNIVKSIDNIPVIDYYEKYMSNEKIENLQGIANQFPLMVKDNDVYSCRNITEIIDKKYIKLNSSISVGQKVRFGYGNIHYTINSSKETCYKISNYPVEALFVYSCIVRLRFLKELIEHEMMPLNNGISISGFFTVGEFGRINGVNKFLSQTMTILTISEDKNARISINENEFLKEDRVDAFHNKILFNLIKMSSDELEEMNSNLLNLVEEKTIEIKKQYYMDALTNLPNRLRLINDISNYKNLKLALLDINSFNEINDFYGNAIGDTLLQSFSSRIKRFGDINKYEVYRVNSDVFAVLSGENVTEESFIEKIKELQMLFKHAAFLCNSQKLYINTSIGIAMSKDNLFEKAGMALNYTKVHNIEFQVYDEELSILKEYENNLEWIKKLNEAIKENRVIPFFQPIYNNKTDKIEKYEALIRMIDRNGEIIAPVKFLDIARRAHIYPQLSRIMINKTFDKFKNTNLRFSINLLVEDIINAETKKLIYNKLKDRRMAKNVVFEIVESEGIENFDEIMEFINTVHSCGGKIAIDDFGSGYSNFKYLTKLNVDYIKIDGSIIKNICSDKTSELVVETIVDFASKLGADVIAEFVLDKEVYIKVRNMGIGFSQGYYFSEPKQNI